MSVAATYAEALFEAASDAGTVDAVAGEIAGFAEAVEESADLRQFLDNPEIEARVKKEAVKELSSSATPITANFLQVLIDRGRITEFPEIARAFAERVAAAEGRLEVEAVTAVPLPDDLRSRIVDEIARKTGRSVDLTESVDPEIVGGLVLRIGGAVVDGSVRHRIEELRAALSAAPVDAALAADAS
ncbi:MAG TPA: ATP synthase F1 subunit delta [Miltoncostaeaceae bacterium]|nr:ATP synthase F1 subunit delta [Miltoncostaeaceae bacterium]